MRFISAGFVDAHTGRVIRTWNQLSTVLIVGVVGNVKTGHNLRYMNVKKTNESCYHIDEKRRIEVNF